MTGPLTPFFDIDETEFPVVIVHVRRPPARGEVQQLLKRLDAVLARRQRFVLLGNMSPSRGSPDDRQRAVEWLCDRLMLLRLFCVAMGFIAPTAAARGVVTAVQWRSPMPWPVAIFDTPPEALRWARRELARANKVPVSG